MAPIPAAHIDRRSFLLSTGAASVAAALAACGGPGASGQANSKGSEKVKKIVFLTNADDTPAKARIKKWNDTKAGSAGFTVELRQTDAATYAANFPRLATASDAPSVAGYFVDGGRYVDLAKAGRLLDLTSFWDSTGLTKNVPKLIRDQYLSLTGDGKLYGAPSNTSRYGILFFRKSVLQAAGVQGPTNHEWASEAEFDAACQQLKSKGLAPISIGGKDGYPISHLQDGLLASVMPPEQIIKPREIDYTSSEWLAPINKLVEWNRKGYFAKGYLGRSTDQANAIFGKKQAGFATGMNVWQPLMLAVGIPLEDLDWCLLPSIGDLPTKVSIYAGGGVVIPQIAAAHEQGKTFAAWLLSPEVALDAAKDGAVIPARTDVPGLQQALGPVGGSMQEFAAQEGRSQFGWDDPAPTAMIEYDRKNLQAVLSGSQSPKQFSDQLEKLKANA